jgi:hypothetical protein
MKRRDLAAIGFCLLGACMSLAVEPSSSGPPTPGKAPTFGKDIAPILFQRCAGCHRPGQPGPFDLLTFSDVKKRSTQILEVVEKRYMPPWLPEKTEFEFADNRSLTVAEIETVRNWIAQGALEGASSEVPSVPRWKEGWRLGEPDLVVRMPQAYSLAAEGKDVYRNFVFSIPAPERKFVRGVEFQPGNSRVVHHAFITIDNTRFSRRLAEKENPPGFNGMLLPETARMPGGQFLGWQPGKVPSFSPPGLGWPLETNSDLVLQLHLHPSGKPEQVQPTVGFYFTPLPPTNTAFRINLNPLIIDIPAGGKDYSIKDEYRLPIDVELVAISPHAHYLARRMHGYAVFPDGTKKDLLLIKDWDFNWQGDYRYATPVSLPKGTVLGMHFTYDNSTENVRNPNQPPKRVKYGLQTTDEMGELWFQVLPRQPGDRNTLARDFYGHLAQRTIDYNEHVLKEDPNDAEAHTRAGRARMFFGQVPEALAHMHAAVKADPKYDRAWYELGFIHLRQNNWAEAQQAFENVVRLNPDDYEAEGSLGVIYLNKGDLDRAEAHFRAALRINPADEIARGNLDRVVRAKSGAAAP